MAVVLVHVASSSPRSCLRTSRECTIADGTRIWCAMRERARTQIEIWPAFGWCAGNPKIPRISVVGTQSPYALCFHQWP
jgi:hypothetical protein